jgi:hypothetical protein
MPEERLRDAVAGRASFNVLHLDTMLKVVLAKLDGYRRGGEASERQGTDALGVLRATGRAR